MSGVVVLIVAALLVSGALFAQMHTAVAAAGASTASRGALAHSHSEFSFTIDAPLATAFPLFGGHGERAWGGPEWDPQFVFPVPAGDVPGAVFRIERANHHAMWVTTIFDPVARRAQHVAFIPDSMVTIVEIRLTAIADDRTHAEVTYERTALTPVMNDHVRGRQELDARFGEEWRRDIAEALGRQGTGKA